MGGIGLSMEFKEMIGKLGKNGLTMPVLMSLFYHYQNNLVKNSMYQLLNNFSKKKKVCHTDTITFYLDGLIHQKIIILPF